MPSAAKAARALGVLLLASALASLCLGGVRDLRPAPRRVPEKTTSTRSPSAPSAPSARTPRASSFDDPSRAVAPPRSSSSSSSSRDAVASASSASSATSPLLCVVAPYRDRPGKEGEVERFVAHASRWLPRVAGVARHSTWIVHQDDDLRFNRGWLLNVGVALARTTDACDYFAVHDIDLLPTSARLPYDAVPETATHLSPPGVHPEYIYPSFKGGAWLFTWEQLKAFDGYSHAYWGWGQEDDDLGARMRRANVAHGAALKYPGPREEPSDAAAAAAANETCTGRVAKCDHDPTERDCGIYPYAALLTMFHDIPEATTSAGLRLPASRSMVEGACFVHAHVGGFSRDLIEEKAPDLISRTSDAFQEGRTWDDVVAGTFRADETTGFERLVPRECDGGAGGVFGGGGEVAPVPGHGFALDALELVDVDVIDGVAEEVRASSHPAMDALGDLPRTAWSGNEYLRRTCRRANSGAAAAAAAGATEKKKALPWTSSYARARVRLTCDEEQYPWCVDEKRRAMNTVASS